MDTITIVGTGESGYANALVKLRVAVNINSNPSMDALPTAIGAVGESYSLALSNINDGDTDDEQTLTITATSDNPGVCPNPVITYIQGYLSGTLTYTPASTGAATITVQVADDKGGNFITSFTVTVYERLNGIPAIDSLAKVDVYNDAGEQTISLTGISDGDNGTQNLTITASSSNTGIIPDPAINYVQGANTATLTYTPNPANKGLVTITVTVSDDGGDVGNNGDKVKTMTFTIETLINPRRGYKVDLSDPGILANFSPEAAGVTYFVSIIDTLGDKALRIEYANKWDYVGIWFGLPEEINVQNKPAISYEVFARDNAQHGSWHWNYLYDAHGPDAAINRNIQNSSEHMYSAPVGSFTNIVFDYRQPGDMNNSQGAPIDAERINAVLFNMHNAKPTWPFTYHYGVVYYRNIRLGDSVTLAPAVPVATIDNIADQAMLVTESPRTITLSGISNGAGSTAGVTVTATSSAVAKVPVPVVGTLNPDGTVSLTITPGESGSSTVTITIEAPGATTKSISFKTTILAADPAGYATITINTAETHQTIRGLGSFMNEPRWSDLYAIDLGASAMRLGIIGNQLEMVNDNDDPNVLDMSVLSYDAFDWEYFRELKEKGVEAFILTSWSPPAWMKRNLSEDHKEQAVVWEATDNVLEPYYYEEFAEAMVAVVKAFKERSGIDILAIGLQNEPFFNEPYPSAILSGTRFATLIQVVGDRFAAEGLSHVGFYMPEQVFGLGFGDYSNEGYLAAVRANPAADAYCRYFAVHGYDGTGVQSGFPSYSNWQSLRNLAYAEPNAKEMWMSETHIGYEGWNSALNMAGALHGSLWAGDITLWTNWGFGDMQLTKNIPNSTFYSSKNYFKFIRPGAIRVTSSASAADLLVTAFRNTDGKLVMVIVNKGTSAISTSFQGNNLPMEYALHRSSKYENCIPAGTVNIVDEALILPASSVTTLVSENNSPLTINQVSNQIVLKNSGEHQVELSGISDGQGSTNGLTLTADVSNPALFSATSVSTIDVSGIASFTYTPATDAIGSALVTLTLTDGSSTRQMSFYIFVNPLTGSDTPDADALVAYPNPASEVLNVRLDSRRYNQLAIQDLSGRTLYATKVSTDYLQVNTRPLTKGYYLLKATGKEGVAIVRVVIE